MTIEGQTKGFGHSNRQISLEIVVLIVGLIAVVGGGYAVVTLAAGALVSVMPTEVDVAIGEAAYGSLAPEENRCTNPKLTAYIESLAKPLIEVANAPFPFKFVVLEDESVNAFALPGGFVAVNYGLIQKAQTAEEIAGVLAHELQHALARHGLKRIARQAGAAVTVGLVLGWLDVNALGAMAAGLVSRSYDRDQEAEADRLGRQLLLDAGILPDGMALFFERLAKDGPTVPTLLSTHPGSEERARLIREGPKFEGRPRKLATPGDWPCHLKTDG